MNDDLIFGVKMDGNGNLAGEAKAARAEIDALKKSTDELGASGQRSADQIKSYWQQQQAAANASAAAWLKGNVVADNANDKAWALANGYKEVGDQILKTGGEAAKWMEQTAFATNRATQEMVILGREVAQGNFSRMPGTLSIIAQGLGPVGWAVAGVTAALAAGAYAWYKWGEDARYATESARAGLDDAKAAADRAQRLTQMERLADISETIGHLGRESLELEEKSRRIGLAGEGGKGELWSYQTTIEEKQREILGLRRQAQGLWDEIEQADKRKQEADRKRNIPEMYIGGTNESGAPQSLAAIAEREQTDARIEMIRERWKVEQAEAEKFAAHQKKYYEDLNHTLTDALMRGFESGSSFARNFVATVQNLFNTLVLRPVISAIMAPVSTAISAGAGALGLSNAASAAGLLGVEQGGYSLAQGALYYQGGGTVAGAYAGSTAAGIGATAAAVAPYAAAAAAAYVIAKYGFGWGNEKENVGPQRLAGTFNRSGFSGSYLQDWKVEGGWFGGGSSGTDAISLNALQSASYKALVAGLQKTFDTLGDNIGDIAIKTQEWSVQVNQAGDVTGALADGMASQLIPALQDLRIEGENLAQTAQRVTNSYVLTTQLISGLGLSEAQAFGMIGIASADARLALVDAAGGLQNFSALAGQFAASILDPAQRLQISLESVGMTFARLGIAGIETNKQFADLVSSELQFGHYDVVGKLLEVSSAFAEVTKSAEETTRQLLDMIKQDNFSTMVDYQRAIGRARNAGGAGTSPLDLAVSSSAAMLPKLQAANASYEELRALRNEVAGLRSTTEKAALTAEETARYSKRIADLLRNVTQDGNSLLTTPA